MGDPVEMGRVGVESQFSERARAWLQGFGQAVSGTRVAPRCLPPSDSALLVMH